MKDHSVEDAFDIYAPLPAAQMKQLDLANERVKNWKAGGVINVSHGQAIGSLLGGAKPVLGTQVGGSHYTDCKIQPIEYIWANNLGFSEGNVVKYVTRWKAKGGIKDLKKAHHHIALLIEHAEAEEANK